MPQPPNQIRTPVAETTRESSSSSGSARAALEKKGCLEASVLSVYDLPFSDEIPKAVTLSTCGLDISTGPPLARHKDRNSFRFAPSSSPKQDSNSQFNFAEPTKLVAPLRDLYQATLTIRVVYADPNKYLQAELPINTLRIHEQKWMILNLSEPTRNKPASSASGETAIQSPSMRRTSSVAEEDMSPPPTIRIKFQLTGPYRPEIAALVNFANAWFGVVDRIEGKFSGSSLGKPVTWKGQTMNKNLLLIPIIPLLAILVAASPFVAGVLMLAVPFLLPLVLICVGGLGLFLLSGGLMYSTTKKGRDRVGTALSPLVETLVISRPGQTLVYDTGPRPTPVSVLRTVTPTTMWSKLWISLMIDLIGSSSYLLPVVGEAFDLAWAPAQTVIIMAMYDATSPNLKYLSFMEEVMPFTDIIPSASIGWAFEFLPLMLRDHAKKNDIHVNPGVSQAVAQLVTTATKVVKNRN